MPKLMRVIVNRYANQSSGYLRVLKNGFRSSGSDRAPLAIVEFVGNPNEIVYHMAKKQTKKVIEQLKQVEAQKYSLKKIVLRDPVSGENINVVKLNSKSTLDGREKKKLGRVEAALQKKIVKFNKAIIRYPLARQIDTKTVEDIDAMRRGDIEKTVPNWKLPRKSLPASSMLVPLKSLKFVKPSNMSAGPAAISEVGPEPTKSKQSDSGGLVGETKKPDVPKSFFQRFFGRF